MFINSVLNVILITTILGVLGIVAIQALHPKCDNTQLIMTLIGFLTPSMMVMLDLIKTTKVHSRLDDLEQKLPTKEKEDG